MDFKNKVVLITGASSGIGKDTAIEFTKKDANIVLVCQCDVSKKDQVKEKNPKIIHKQDPPALIKISSTNKKNKSLLKILTEIVG